MRRQNPYESCYGTLNYDGSSNAAKQHSILLSGHSSGKVRIDNIFFSYALTDNSTTAIQTGRLVIFEGKIDETKFVDPLLTDFTTVAGVSRVRLDLLTTGSGHRVMSLTNLGILVEEATDITVLLTPAYRAGDTLHQPGLTLATLNISVSQVASAKSPELQLEFV